MNQIILYLTSPSDNSSPTTLYFYSISVIPNRLDPTSHILDAHANLSSSELHSSISLILDTHAPEITKTVISRPDSSWYTPHLLKQKRLLRKAELSHLNHPTDNSLLHYKTLKNTYRKQITTAKNSSIASKFSSIYKDSKSIFRLSAKLLGRSLKPPLPVATPEELPLLFDNFFSDKLANILATLATPATPLSQPITNPRPGVSLEQLQTPSLTLIISLLKDTKTCSSLDPLPLVLSKQVTSNIAIYCSQLYVLHYQPVVSPLSSRKQ